MDLILLSFFFLGPRFVLNLIKVFQGSFGGPTLYENSHYITPNAVNLLVVVRLLSISRYSHHIDVWWMSQIVYIKIGCGQLYQ